MKKVLITLAAVATIIGGTTGATLAKVKPLPCDQKCQTERICGPVNYYNVTAAYKATYCAKWQYPTGSYWVELCAKYPDYCMGL